MNETSAASLSADQVEEWRASRTRLQERITSIDVELAQNAGPAMTGEADVATLHDLQEERDGARSEIELLDLAIASGEAELARQLQADAEAARAVRCTEAERLKALQRAEAGRVDAAFAELEAATAAYRELGLQRARAERAAGLNDSRKSKLLGVELERALWASAPTVASLLQVESRMRRHASKLRDQ